MDKSKVRKSCYVFNMNSKNCISFLGADTVNSAKMKIMGEPIDDGKEMDPM